MKPGEDRLAQAQARIIVALDVPSAAQAMREVRRLQRRAGMVKVGAQLYSRAGPEAVRRLVRQGERVFLDLKFHDIPHIVAEACSNAAALGASLLTVHTAGGPRMLRAARKALEGASRRQARPLLLGVTVLTSLDARDLKKIGLRGRVDENVIRLTKLALRNGCDGIIAAPTDVAALRRACGDHFLIVTPGIRAASGSKPAGQRRVATAAAAIRAGADFVVVGRAILSAPSPARALAALAREVEQVLP